jgi:hypothetical protein
MRRTHSLLTAAAIAMAIVPSLALAVDAERVAFYQACGDRPGRAPPEDRRFGSYPAGERERPSARCSSASRRAAWQGTKAAVDRAEAMAIVSREGETYPANQRSDWAFSSPRRTSGREESHAPPTRRRERSRGNAARPADVITGAHRVRADGSV